MNNPDESICEIGHVQSFGSRSKDTILFQPVVDTHICTSGALSKNAEYAFQITSKLLSFTLEDS